MHSKSLSKLFSLLTIATIITFAQLIAPTASKAQDLLCGLSPAGTYKGTVNITTTATAAFLDLKADGTAEFSDNFGLGEDLHGNWTITNSNIVVNLDLFTLTLTTKVCSNGLWDLTVPSFVAGYTSRGDTVSLIRLP